MTPAILLTLGLLGLAVATMAACAVLVLHEFRRHEMEDYCLRRGQPDTFRQIIELREQLGLGAQTVQLIAIVVCLGCGILLFFPPPDEGSPTLLQVLALTGSGALLLLVTNSWIPQAIFSIAAESFLYRTWRIWWAATLFLSPLISGVQVVSSLLQRVTGRQPAEETSEEAFEDEFMSMVSEGEHEGLLEADAREMIEGVFELDDSIVGKVMTPRSKVDVIEAGTSWDEMSRIVVDCGRTRIPVTTGQFSRPDDVVGILFVKDLLSELALPEPGRRSWTDLVRPPLEVPDSKPLDEMLELFQAERSHLAIVVDEYQAIAGVITIEDILEEIVGEIVDETDEEEPGDIQRIDVRTLEVDGTVRLDLLNDELGLDFPVDEDFDTLSGLIMARLGSIPRSGQTLEWDRIRIRIQQASRRTIERVQMTLLEVEPDGSGSADLEPVSKTESRQGNRHD